MKKIICLLLILALGCSVFQGVIKNRYGKSYGKSFFIGVMRDLEG